MMADMKVVMRVELRADHKAGMKAGLMEALMAERWDGRSAAGWAGPMVC